MAEPTDEMDEQHDENDRMMDEIANELVEVLAARTTNPALAFGAAFTLLLHCSRNVMPASRNKVLGQIKGTLRKFWAAWDEWDAADEPEKPVM